MSETHPLSRSQQHPVKADDLLIRRSKVNRKSGATTSGTVGPNSRPKLAAVDGTLRTSAHMAPVPNTNGAKKMMPENTRNRDVVPLLPLSEIGKASRFGDKTLSGNICTVFEVVLQRKEGSVCPACVKSPRRAQLPAHARGCFGLS